MIIDCGRIAYMSAWQLQHSLVAQRSRGEIDDTLIIAEHEPVITIGRSGSRAHLHIGEAAAAAQGISIIDVDRGGDITFHGPGQLILYPIIDLHSRPDLHRYMRDLEEVGIMLLKDFGVTARRVNGRTGVWVNDDKIASIGIGARNWITYHGMSINISTDLNSFLCIDPCGMPQVRMTSLERVCAPVPSHACIKERLIYHAQTLLMHSPLSYAHDHATATVA